MTLKVPVAWRRTRLMTRHLLAARPGSAVTSPTAPATSAMSVTEAAEAMIALHATDPVTVYLSAWARTGCATTDVEGELYESRRLVRALGMRRTMWVVPAAHLPVVQRACTDDVAARLRRQLAGDLAKAGIGGADPDGWLRDAGDGVLSALSARGSATGSELAADEPRLRTQLVYAPGKSYGGPANITSRVLMLLSAEGRIVRGRPRGGWSSGTFTYHPAGAWLDGAAPGGGADGGESAPGTGPAGANGGGSSLGSGPARVGDGGQEPGAARAELA
ncbi:MAG: winged helix DNA-binding domain-containing protein, partial [Nocardiopsaceae bacterium]|nr:winged helix DNA-binding domain-containing protein [Nocardiopsaceae bacterium]